MCFKEISCTNILTIILTPIILNHNYQPHFIYENSEKKKTEETCEIKVAKADFSLWSERIVVDVRCFCLTCMYFVVVVVDSILIFLQGNTPTTLSIYMVPKKLMGCPDFPYNTQ